MCSKGQTLSESGLKSRQRVSKWRKKGNKIRKHGAPRPKLYKLYIPPSREDILWLEGGSCTERQSTRLKFISAGDKALTGVYVNDGPMDSSPWRRRNSSLALTGSMWMEMTVRSQAVQRATAGMDNHWGLSFVWWGEHMEYFFTIKSLCTKTKKTQNIMSRVWSGWCIYTPGTHAFSPLLCRNLDTDTESRCNWAQPFTLFCTGVKSRPKFRQYILYGSAVIVRKGEKKSTRFEEKPKRQMLVWG